MPDDDIVTSGYDAVYGALPGNETFQRIWARHACGADFPVGFDHTSFLTGPEIDAVLEYLRLPPSATLVDVACGAGGPGLWLAQRSGASLLGVDLSRAGLDWARRRSQSVTMAGSATFIEGSFATTGLASSLADGLISFDALHYAPDKSATFSEAARILRPRGRLVFTAFEIEPELVLDLPVLGADPSSDFRPALERAGFAIESYEETLGWRERVTSAYQAVLDAQDVLSQELGIQAFIALASEMRLAMDRNFYRRRVMAVASRH